MPDPKFVPVPTTWGEEEEAVTPVAPPLSVGDRVADAVDSVNSGIGQGFHQMADAAVSAGTKLLETGEGITNKVFGTESGIAGELKQSFKDLNESSAESDGSTYKPKTVVGVVSQPVSQFLTGMVTGGKILEGAKVAQGASTLARGFVTGAFADAAAFDPSQDRLSNLFNDFAESHPSLRNPLTDYLAADENDSEADGRLKNAMEGLIAGGVLDRVFAGLKGLRSVYKTRETAGAEAAQKKWAEVATELDQTGDATAVGFKDGEVSGGTRTGDDLSQTKAVGTDGKPLTVYHGTNDAGVVLDKDIPTYFTANKTDGVFTNTKNVIEAQVDIRNPLTPAIAKERIGEIEEAFERFNVPEGNRKEILNGIKSGNADAWFFVPPEARKAYEALGFDGLHVNDGLKDEWWVPFSGRQIRQVDAKADATLTTETVAVGKVEAQNRAVRNINQPLLDQSEIDSLINTIRHNPEFLSEGVVRPNQNYNYDRLLTDDGAKLALDEVAKLVTPILDAGHRSHKSFQAIKDTAEFFGGNPEQLLVDLQKAYKDTKNIEATLVAGRSLVAGLTLKANKLARQFEIDPSVHEELQKTLQQAANVDKLVRGTRSSAARATAAGRIDVMANLSAAEIKALQVASPEQFLKIVQGKSAFAKGVDAHNEYWINALLSGARTHIRNIVSNAINTVALPAERMIGGLMMGNKEQIRAGAATYMGLRSAVLDSIVLASKASGLTDLAKNPMNPLAVAKKTGDSILDPKNAKLNGDTRAITAQNFGITQPHAATIFDAFGEFVRIPGRFLTAEDEFFKQLNYRAKVYSDATTEGLSKNLKGKNLSDFIESRIDNAFNGAGNAADEAALNYARRATFTSVPERGSFLHSLETFAGQHPALRMLIPFIRTPTNILKEAALRTPGLNLLSKKYRDALAGKLGDEAKAQAYGQFATGAAMWTAGLTLALEGHITGRGPADPREKQTLLDTGWRPYSFKVGDSYISFEGFDPTSMFFGMAGDFADAYGHMQEGQRANVMGSMLVAMATNITSKTYLQGLTQAMEALTQPERKGHSFLKSRVSSYVPAGLKQFVGLVPGAEDPYMRETRSVLDAVINKLPGLSQTLPPRRNIFGEPVTATKAFGPDSISPFYYSTQKDDKAAQELARFSHAFSPPSRSIGDVDLTLFTNAKGQDFYDRWQEQIATLRVGRYTLKERLENLVTSPSYQKWRENEADAIENGAAPRTLKEVQAVVEEYRQHAKQKTLKEFPEVADLVRAQKKVQVRANAGAEVPDALQNIINQLTPQ